MVCRFRQIPSFSQATIHRFTNNVSQMKKLAACDFEDLLQCSIPAFEDLLDEPHNKRLMKLLYRTAEWHAFAKLRMHTNSTLEHLEVLTKEFGYLMQQFRDLTCSEFRTAELPCEAAAWNRQQQHAQARVSLASTTGTASAGSQLPSCKSSAQMVTLNLSTIKFHSLGDYMRTIQMFGCMDSFSTQLVGHLQLCTQIKCSKNNHAKGELAHRLVKWLYGQMNKRDMTKQISQHVR
jgi:hypothetical protein